MRLARSFSSIASMSLSRPFPRLLAAPTSMADYRDLHDLHLPPCGSIIFCHPNPHAIVVATDAKTTNPVNAPVATPVVVAIVAPPVGCVAATTVGNGQSETPTPLSRL